MSSIFSHLPPPFPNAAQSLSRISGDVQLRERVERVSESKPIKTDFPPEVAHQPEAGTQSDSQNDAPSGGAGNRIDVSV